MGQGWGSGGVRWQHLLNLRLCFPFGSPYSHLEAWNRWWLLHPCLLIWQEIFYFTTGSLRWLEDLLATFYRKSFSWDSQESLLSTFCPFISPQGKQKDWVQNSLRLLQCSPSHFLTSGLRPPLSSSAQLCPTLCNPMNCSTPGFLFITNSWSLLKLMSTESVMPSNHLVLCRPLLLLPSIFPNIRVFSNESALHNSWPKYWSFSFSISPSNYFQDWFPLGLTGLISLLSKGLSRVFFNTTVQKHQFFSAQPSLWSNSCIHTWLHGKTMAQMVKCLLAMQETRVWSLGLEDPLEKEMATHSSTLAWKISWMEEPGGLQSMGSQSRTQPSDFIFLSLTFLSFD